MPLARQHENYRFPSDDEFERQLKDADLYGLRICRHLLEGLENHGTKEPTDTSSYSIEHIMPQNERLPRGWRDMLGENWKDIQKTWLHRLGNLTLTGYNSTYSDRDFEEKKTIEGGFSDSSVRLNKFVREQPVWTPTEMTARTNDLAKRALKVWPPLKVEQALIDAAAHLEMRNRAARQDIGKIKMTLDAKALFEDLRSRVMALVVLMRVMGPVALSRTSREVVPGDAHAGGGVGRKLGSCLRSRRFSAAISTSSTPSAPATGHFP